MNKRRTRIVVLGGGHGQAAICRGIKKIEDAEITAIVTMAEVPADFAGSFIFPQWEISGM